MLYSFIRILEYLFSKEYNIQNEYYKTIEQALIQKALQIFRLFLKPATVVLSLVGLQQLTKKLKVTKTLEVLP